MRHKISKILGEDISQTSTASPTPREEVGEMDPHVEKMKKLMSVIRSESNRRISKGDTDMDHLISKNEAYLIEIAKLRQNCSELEDRVEQLKRMHDDELENLDRSRRVEIKKIEEKFDEAINKNLDMIDKLLTEKRDYCNRIDCLVKERDFLSEKMKKSEDKFKAMLKREVTREREVIIEKEKLSRATWEQQKVEEIKDQITRKMGQEIEHILSLHMQEKKVVALKHLEEIETIKREYMISKNEEVRRIQSDFAEKLHRAIETERSLSMEKEKVQFDKYAKEIENEREARITQLKRATEMANEREASVRLEMESEIAKLRCEHDVEKQRLESRNREETDNLVTSVRRDELEKIKQIEREKSDLECRIGKTIADNIVLRDEVHSRSQIIDDLNRKLEEERSGSFRWKTQLDETKMALDDAKFENLNLIERIKIAENKLEIFKASQLNRCEEHVDKLVLGNNDTGEKTLKLNYF